MASWADRDRRVLWHPFTQHAEWEADPGPVIVRAEGMHLIDEDGRRLLDGNASLWVCVHGHREPALDDTVADQLARAAHTTFLGLTHPPAIELAEQLVALAPDGLSRVFYSDNGATAVEVALKMAFQHFAHRGETERRRFISIAGDYHGDTLGAVSVGGIDVFHSAFRPLLFETVAAEPDDVPAVIEREGERLCGVIVEPTIQAAAGMRLHRRGWLAEVRAACDRAGALLICDEVATGFGRTGSMWACEAEGVRPDLLSCGKALTGGYLPLAATLATEDIYASFLGPYDEFKAFFHGHTYTANPLACAVALANLRLIEKRDVIGNVRARAAQLAFRLARLASDQPAVGEVRQAGLMAAIDLVHPATGCALSPGARFGGRACRAARDHGAVVRPLGDAVTIVPPLAIAAADLDALVDAVAAGIADAAAEVAEEPPPEAPTPRVAVP